jgi:hypothetical protein
LIDGIFDSGTGLLIVEAGYTSGEYEVEVGAVGVTRGNPRIFLLINDRLLAGEPWVGLEGHLPDGVKIGQRGGLF